MAYSEQLTRWLGLSQDFSSLVASSPSLRSKEKRPDLMIELSEGSRKKRFIIECDTRPASRVDLERRMALLQGNFSKRGCDLEQIVLNLTGGDQPEETLELSVKTRIINLACMEAPEDIKSWPLGALPFVGLMKNAKDKGISETVLRASAEGGEHRLLLIAAIYEFASLGKGEEFVMRVQEKVRHRNPFVELIEQVRKEGREEALEEGRVEGRVKELRSTLRDLISRKFPQIKAATITKRLKACDEPTLRGLVLRILDDLSWKQFWASENSPRQ
jgi:hypothetical protein